MHKLIKIISDVLFVGGLLVAGFVLVGKFTDFTPFRVFIVSSGSMEPNIKTGSVVITIPQKEYKIADIVTFKSGTDKKATTTHRIVGIGTGVIRTAGDANNQPDPALIDTSKIVGRVVLSVPYLGYLAGFAQTPRGFILLVIVPATIIVYEELKALILEIRKVKFSKKNLPSPQLRRGAGGEVGNTEWQRNLRPAIIIPVFCAAFILSISFSLAYFSDTETSSSNSFTAWVETPPPNPIAETLVINELISTSHCDLGGGKSAAWIELWNGYSTPVDLKNYKLNDGANTIDIVNSNTTLPSYSFALLAKDNSVWTQCYTPFPGTITINLGSGISLTSGILRLMDTDGVTVLDRVEYGGVHFDLLPDQSIERNLLGLDNSSGDSFTTTDFSIQCPSTPGTWVTPTNICSVVINEINWAGSSASTDDEWIELRNTTASDINLTGWKIKGATSGGGGILTISSGTIPANGFFLISHFAATNPNSKLNITPDITTTSVQLNNTNVQYILSNSNGIIVDIADDGSGNPLAGSNTAPKKSMERKSSPGDGTIGTNWQTATTQINLDAGAVELATPKFANP